MTLVRFLDLKFQRGAAHRIGTFNSTAPGNSNMAARVATKFDRVRQLTELEDENTRLHQTAAVLAVYLRALQASRNSGAPPPRRPTCIGGRGDAPGSHGA